MMDMACVMGVMLTIACLAGPAMGQVQAPASDSLRIGWAQEDITPTRPAALGGMGYLRVSTHVQDPLTVTALAIEAPHDKQAPEQPPEQPPEQVIFVSADLMAISGDMMKAVRASLREHHPQVNPDRVMFNATHTHTAPPLNAYGQQVDAMLEPEYLAFAAPRIAATIAKAWQDRQPGGVSYGLSHAVVGHNRVATYESGQSQLNGKLDRPDFSHIEGYEDHAVNLLYTWDAQQRLTGVLINVAVTAQTRQSERVVSADIWHETRQEIRKRLGEGLFILPQVTAAGDQMSRAMVYARAEARMEKLTGRTRREQIAHRLADAVMAILPAMRENIEWSPMLRHHWESVPLTRRQLLPRDVEDSQRIIAQSQAELEKLQAELQARPELASDAGWVRKTTRAQWNLNRARRVLAIQDNPDKVAVELHVARLGDAAFATSPFELYLDYGVRIRVRSKAVQTFVVELTNDWLLYLPTRRSVEGGAYGGTPASSRHVGPEGGAELVEWTVKHINALWAVPAAPASQGQ